MREYVRRCASVENCWTSTASAGLAVRLETRQIWLVSSNLSCKSQFFLKSETDNAHKTIHSIANRRSLQSSNHYNMLHLIVAGLLHSDNDNNINQYWLPEPTFLPRVKSLVYSFHSIDTSVFWKWCILIRFCHIVRHSVWFSAIHFTSGNALSVRNGQNGLACLKQL